MRWLLLLLLFPSLVLAQGDFPRALEDLRSERQEALAELQGTREGIARERRALEEEIRRLRERLGQLQGEVSEEQRRFERLRSERDRLLRGQGEMEAEVKALEGVIRAFARDLKAYFDQALTAGEGTDREAVLGRALQEGRFPGLEDLSALVGLAMEEIRLARETVLLEKEFLGPKGEPLKGKVLRAGEIVAYWVDGRRVLPLLASGGKLRALGGELPFRVRRAVRSFAEGKGRDLYIDPSHGAAFAFEAERPGFYEHLRSGGPIVVPILLIGLFALGVVIERLIYFRRIRVPGGLKERVISLAREGRWEALAEVLGQHRGHPLGRVLLRLLQERGKGREVLEAALDEALLREGVGLERFLQALRVMGAVAPLLGLLGTVVGIISTFRAITLFGTGNPRLMAGGISEALVTTEVGLMVAIPVMLLHSYLSSRAERASVEVEEAALGLIGLMEGEDGGSP